MLTGSYTSLPVGSLTATPILRDGSVDPKWDPVDFGLDDAQEYRVMLRADSTYRLASLIDYQGNPSAGETGTYTMAIVRVGADDARVEVNLLTSMAAPEVQRLWGQGRMSVDEATVQAEQRIIGAVQVGPPGFEPAAGSSLSLTGGANADNAWLLALWALTGQASPVLDEVAPLDSGHHNAWDVVAVVQQGDAVSLYEEAERKIDVEGFLGSLVGLYQDLIAMGDFPDLQMMIDSDGDGVFNDIDTCPFDVDPSNADSDGDGEGDVCDCVGTCFTGLTGLSAGDNHTCGLLDGALWCWGGAYGATPAQVALPATGAVFAVGAAGDTTCALADQEPTQNHGGRMWCWHGVEAPQEIPLPAQPNETEAYGWTAAAVGRDHVCGSVSQRHNSSLSLWCWGANDQGQLGQGAAGSDELAPLVVDWTTDPTSTTFTQWDHVVSGDGFSCAQCSSGRENCGPDALYNLNQVYCWGRNDLGQTTGSEGAYASPRQLESFAGPVKAIAANDQATCAIEGQAWVEEASDIWCWGEGTSTGQGAEDCAGVACDRAAVPIAGPADWAQVAATDDGFWALTHGGELYRWGGRLKAPKRYGDGASWQEIAAGGQHICARARSGIIFCWGPNDQGQLGQGDLTPHDGWVGVVSP